MNKKYIVRLTDEERWELVEVIAKLKGTSQKVKRAHILPKADAEGPNSPHYQIAEAFLFRTKTVSNVCKLLAKAITYTLNQWEALLGYIDDPTLEIDNNLSERTL